MRLGKFFNAATIPNEPAGGVTFAAAKSTWLNLLHTIRKKLGRLKSWVDSNLDDQI
jgi:hypothetical protein